MSEWCSEISLKEVVYSSRQITYGIVQPGPDVAPDGVPLIRGKDYSSGRVDTSNLYHVSEAIDRPYARSKVYAGDILFSIVGYVGLIAEVPPELEGANITQTTARISVDPSIAYSKFIRYVLSADHYKPHIRKYEKGSAQAGLNLADVARLAVPLPSLPQQRRIAEILSTVDEAIEQTEALIAKTQHIKSGLMHDLFTRGVTEDGKLRPPREEAPQLYKESPIGWIPKEWEVVRLAEVAEVNRGKFTVRPRNDPRYYGGSHPFIQTGDVAEARGRWLNSYSQTLNNLGLAVSRSFPVGTIMVTIAANICDTCILGLPMCAPDSLVGVEAHKGEVVRFLELAIRRSKRWLENRAPQTAQKNINLEDLRPLRLPYPSSGERNRIADMYDSMDKREALNEGAIEKLNEMKRGLMQDLLTGRVRVRTNSSTDTEEADV
ncbi:restriction endonuclease subunit S [bacterium]|nr:restriction endonuclease subunit S [bacterium]